MKILLTGVTGLIGKHLTERLLREKYEVVALSRSPDQAKTQFPFPIQFFPWKPLSSKELRNQVPPEAFEKVNAVIHLAGEPVAEGRWTREKKKRIYNSRVVGTFNLMRSIAALPKGQRPPTVICASAVGFYGDRADEILTETSEVGNDFLAQVCTAWEKEALGNFSELGSETRRLAIRSGMVLAKDGGALEKLLPIFKAGLGGSLGTGRQWMSWIHIEDLVELFIFLLRHSETRGVFNGVSPFPVPQREFARVLARAVRRPAILRIPKFALKLGIGEVANVILASQRVIPQKALESKFQFQFETIEKAVKDLVRR